MSKSFLDFFPLPKFLAMPTVGLSISDSTVRTVEFRQRNGALGVYSWSEQALPSGIVTGGLITNPAQLGALLTKLAHEKSVQWLRFALPEEKCFVYSTTISFPEGTKLDVPAAGSSVGPTASSIETVVPRELVATTLAQNIPLPPSDVIFDFSVLAVDAKARTAQVVVYAFPLALAKAYADAFTAAGMTPLSFETESQSLARAVLQHGKVGTDLIVHFMTHKTIIAIVSDGRVVYASTIAHASEAAAKNAAEVATMKESVELLTIRDELLKVISYWHSMRGREKKDKIQSVVVSGNVSTMLDLPDYISKHAGIPSRLANVWQNAFSTDDHIPEIPFEKSLEFTAAVGLALASTIPHHA